MNIIENIEREQLRDDIPQFKAGDTVKVHFKVVEGTRHRIQVFQGIVIKQHRAGAQMKVIFNRVEHRATGRNPGMIVQTLRQELRNAAKPMVQVRHKGGAVLIVKMGQH